MIIWPKYATDPPFVPYCTIFKPSSVFILVLDFPWVLYLSQCTSGEQFSYCITPCPFFKMQQFIFLENLILGHRVDKFPASNGTWRYVTMSTIEKCRVQVRPRYVACNSMAVIHCVTGGSTGDYPVFGTGALYVTELIYWLLQKGNINLLCFTRTYRRWSPSAFKHASQYKNKFCDNFWPFETVQYMLMYWSEFTVCWKISCQ